MSTEEAKADGQFQPVHRAGYQTDKLEWLMQWLALHPDATLASGEGRVLLDEINRVREVAQAKIDALQARVRELESTILDEHSRLAQEEAKPAAVVADRDRLAACVERVRKVTRVKIGVGPYPDRDYTEVVHVSDILDALEGDA